MDDEEFQALLEQLGPPPSTTTQSGPRPVTVDIGNGQMVEFPDEASMRQFFEQRQQTNESSRTSLADIRAMDPRYADIPARDLLQALHRQSYSDIPFDVFVARIDGAQEALLGFPSPTGGISANPQAIDELQANIPTGPEIGTAINQGIEGLTFGLVGDEFNAAFDSLHPNITYDERLQWYRDNEEQLREDRPGLAVGSELVGGAAGAMVPIGAGVNLLRGANLGTRMLAGAGGGAAMAGTHEFMEGEGGFEGRRDGMGAALGAGAAVGGIAPVAGGLLQRVLDAVARRAATRSAAEDAPTTQELRDQAQAIYGRIDDAGLHVRPETARATAIDLVDYLESQGAGLTSAKRSIPQANAVLGDFHALAQTQEPTPWLALDMIRRGLGNASSAADGNDARILGQTLADFDESVARFSPDDVVSGDVSALGELTDARNLWSQQARTGLLDDAIENGTSGGYLGSDASGIRNQIGSILRDPVQRGRFSEAELSLLRRAASGTLPQQILYGLQSGLGNMFTMGSGLAAGGLPGLAAGGLASMGLRGLSNRTARNAAQTARDVVANGGMEEMPQASDLIRRMIQQAVTGGGAVAAQTP